MPLRCPTDDDAFLPLINNPFTIKKDGNDVPNALNGVGESLPNGIPLVIQVIPAGDDFQVMKLSFSVVPDVEQSTKVTINLIGSGEPPQTIDVSTFCI